MAAKNIQQLSELSFEKQNAFGIFCRLIHCCVLAEKQTFVAQTTLRTAEPVWAKTNLSHLNRPRTNYRRLLLLILVKAAVYITQSFCLSLARSFLSL